MMLVAAGSASAYTVMRVGETGVSNASLDKSVAIPPRVLARTGRVQFFLTGNGQVEDFTRDENYNRVSRGLVTMTPAVTGSWRITCERKRPYDYAVNAGSLFFGQTIIRALPLTRPTSCRVSISAYAIGAAEYPDEDRVTVIQALVTTVPAASPRKARN